MTEEEVKYEAGQEKLLDVNEYKFQPIKGYPLLNWRGKRPFTSTQYYPAQLKEIHGEEVNGWRNKIFWGDNLQVMAHLLKDYRGKIKLVYIDPPYDSSADYKKKIKLRGQTIRNDHNSFEGKQYTDIWSNDEYLQFMYERIIMVRELLSEDGSFYLHCDYRKAHHLRCLIDEVFGPNNFVNHIIWKRRTNTIKGISTKFSTNTDHILFYAKSSNLKFNIQYEDYDDDYYARFKFEDETGKYRWQVMATYSQERLKTLKDEGRLRYSEKAKYPEFKQYLHELKGRPIQDIWTDINMINAMGIERLDYPTQKPEEILERIILSSSNPGDIVFDCFMGSGTTQSVAFNLGRRFLGSDINLGALQTTTKRLHKLFSNINDYEKSQLNMNLDNKEGNKPENILPGFEVFSVNNYDIFRNPLEAKDLLIKALEINSMEQVGLYDGEKDGRLIKIMPINRLSTKEDLNELISGFDYLSFEKRMSSDPNKPVEKITLVCMGHEPALAATLKNEVLPYKIDVEVVDILKDKQDLQFKRDSEAEVKIKDNHVNIEQFYPMNLLKKLSLQKEKIDDWREMVESVMIDWNFDGAVLEPVIVDIPEKNGLVKGKYKIPDDAGTIRIKITDLLSESLEIDVEIS